MGVVLVAHNVRKTKQQIQNPNQQRLAPALFTPTALLETDVLSDLRVSDEASTLPSDLCVQQSK